MLKIIREDDLDILKQVQVTVVDNFQGEENDIILLSLVRSNPEGRIGFLATENRVCVALSRAKQGFIMVGNMDILAADNRTWKAVKRTLEAQEAIGIGLPIKYVCIILINIKFIYNYFMTAGVKLTLIRSSALSVQKMLLNLPQMVVARRSVSRFLNVATSAITSATLWWRTTPILSAMHHAAESVMLVFIHARRNVMLHVVVTAE